MRLTQQISVTLVTPPTSDAEPTCRLLHEGRDTGVTLPGAVLQAAVELASGWLLFLTHDVPYEEGVEICLLSASYELLDRATIAAPYATGVFKKLEIIAANSLRFEFLGERPWRVELLVEAGFRLPFVSEPLGVHRAVGFSRHFVLSHG